MPGRRAGAAPRRSRRTTQPPGAHAPRSARRPRHAEQEAGARDADRGAGGAGVGAGRAVPRARTRRGLARRPAGARVGGRGAPRDLAPYDPPAVQLRAVPRGRAQREAPAAADGPADDPARPAVRRRGRRRRPRGRGRPGVPARRRPGRRQDRHRDPRRQGGRRAARRPDGARVADRPAAITIPHWARSIAGFGDGGLRWCVTTWDRLAKVAQADGSTSSSPTRRTWCGTRRRSGGSTGRRCPAPAGSRTPPTCWPRPRRRRTRPLELPYLAPEFAVRHGEAAPGVVGPARRGWPRTGSTWNVAATAGSGPRTPTSGERTCRGCRAGWPRRIRPPRCTGRRRGARSR